MVRRLPLFALCWLAGASDWAAVLVLGSGLSLPRATLVVAVQLVVLAAIVGVADGRATPRAILITIVAGCSALGVSATGAFLLARGNADFLAFVLLTLYLSSSLFFGWGWRPALALLVATVVAWLLALPHLPVHLPAIELAGAIFLGSFLALGIAEGYARSFAASFRHEAERDAVRARERAALAEAERARATAEEATRAKDRFLAVVSHELRSPLAAALNWAYMLRQRLDDEAAGLAIEGVERSVQLSVRLIEDLLDVSRITQGKLRLEMADVDLRGIVSAVADSNRLLAEAKRVTLAVRLPQAPVRVHGDAGRLRQIVENLLSNAVKFTPEGGRIDVDLRPGPQGGELTVRDTGVGIPAGMLPHVFEPFRQGDSSTTRRHAGLGLGLAITRQLVELHGGEVRAESPGPDQGTTVTIELPVPALLEEPAPWPGLRAGSDHDAPSLQGLSVLVVDDEQDAGEAVRRLLEMHGATVNVERSARDALARLEHESPDVLISDIAMPGMDGFDLIQQVRASPTQARSVPAAALTAFSGPEVEEKVRRAGFQTFVPKPVAPEDLASTVARLAARRRGH
jgi:hypothetical protein